MATTSGAAPLAPEAISALPSLSAVRARGRIATMVHAVGALVGRRRVASAPPLLVDAGAVRGTGPSGLVPPAPRDKPFTVAHYQAMASQVAYERQIAALAGHVEAPERSELPGEVLFTARGPGAPGGRRHG